MPDSRRHPHKALSSLRVNSIATPGRYGDGNGLYLVVDPSGAKRWVLRTIVQGKRRDIGLGGLRLVSLAEARTKAQEYRKLAREGGNPLDARRKERANVPTFAEAAQTTLEQRRAGWRNEKHATQWMANLKLHVFPALGNKRVDHIDTADVLRALSPIWLSKPETARRARQRISTILDWAKAAGHRSGDNPVDGVAKGLPRQSEKRGHFDAIPYADVPQFLQRLSGVTTSEFARLGQLFIGYAALHNPISGMAGALLAGPCSLGSILVRDDVGATNPNAAPLATISANSQVVFSSIAIDRLSGPTAPEIGI